MAVTKPFTVTCCSATVDSGERLSTVTVFAARLTAVVVTTVLPWMSVERVSETTPSGKPDSRSSVRSTVVGVESSAVARSLCSVRSHQFPSPSRTYEEAVSAMRSKEAGSSVPSPSASCPVRMSSPSSSYS